jgi:hypothetical protein
LEEWTSVLTALLFSLHPLRVDSVAWVAERKDVLCAFFYLLAMLAYIRFTEQPSRGRYAAVLLLLLCALAAKPMAITFPLAMLIADFWPLVRFQRVNWGTAVLEKLPMLAVCVVVSVLTLIGQNTGGAVSTTLPVGTRVLNVMRSYCVYLTQTLWPGKLGILYTYPSTFPVHEVALSAVLLIGISWFAWRSRTTQPWWLAGWLWYLVVLLPVIGLIQAGPQAHADRFTYLPMTMATAALVTGIAKRWPKQGRQLSFAGMVLAGALFLLSWRQIGFFSDNVLLYSHSLEVSPGSYLAHLTLGLAEADRNHWDEALQNYD